MPSGGLSSRASKAWAPAPGKGPTQHPLPRAPSTLPSPRTRGPLAPRQHPGAAGAPGRSPCVAGLCPLQGGRTVRVFQATPGTVGVSSTGTQWSGSSRPAGGSTATTWGRAAGGTGASLPQGTWPLPGCDRPQCARGPSAPVLWGAILCWAVPCHAVPFCAVPGRAMLCLVILPCAMPCCASPCHAVPGPAVLCLAKLCCALPCQALLCLATQCHAMPC